LFFGIPREYVFPIFHNKRDAAQSFDYEILIVLDDPTNNTRDVLKQLSGKNLTIIDRQVNRGKGFTVKEGMLQALGQARSLTLTTPRISRISRKRKALFDQGCDLVIASRNSLDASEAEQTSGSPALV
jgi:glycosyltransferase involved in cell wall biosynthesis